jgi:hypothetical protein
MHLISNSYSQPTAHLSSKELLGSARNVLRLVKRLKVKQSSSKYGLNAPCSHTVSFLNSLSEDIEHLVSTLQDSLKSPSFVQRLSYDSALKKDFHYLISHCALLEMKNLSIRTLTINLKQELKRLNQLQSYWFNTMCLKN